MCEKRNGNKMRDKIKDQIWTQVMYIFSYETWRPLSTKMNNQLHDRIWNQIMTNLENLVQDQINNQVAEQVKIKCESKQEIN